MLSNHVIYWFPNIRTCQRNGPILSPLAGSSNSYIRNFKHFVAKIRNITLKSCAQLVSFDVQNLFTNVPDEALSRVAKLLHEDSTLEDRTTMSPTTIFHLTELCLRTTYFEFQEEFYEQTYGAAMGPPLSPVITNIYTEGFEEEALNTADDQPSLWVHYVDDTFVIWPHGSDKLEAFHRHLNSLRESIQLTIEKEENNCLPFLDVSVRKKIARVVPIPKSGSSKDSANYRPISILTVISKLLGKHIHNLLLLHLFCIKPNLSHFL